MSETARSRWPFRIAMATILIFLFLQAASTFKLLCPPVDPEGRFGFLRVACDPKLWPFMQYPMYSIPHYPGDTVSMYEVKGTLEDSSVIQITPADLGITFWHFQTFAKAILENASDSIMEYAELYERRHNTQLTALQLVDRPWILEVEGPRQGDSVVLAQFELGESD